MVGPARFEFAGLYHVTIVLLAESDFRYPWVNLSNVIGIVYHGLKTEADRRSVPPRYWDSVARHDISPYDPAPLDPIRVE